jgi:3-phenylpropionate/trans-cinnamate dioxygenase ferredoxin reductase subunit
MLDRTVIIGAGHAGTTLAASLRDEGYDGSIVLLSAERELPYHRPQLSKGFLKSADEGVQHLRPRSFYEDNGIDLWLGHEIREIDLADRRVVSGGGIATAFTRLAIATGGRPRRYGGENADLPGIEYLRSIEDARRLKRSLSGLENLVVVGGGFIGLELAASLTEMGVAVTVLESAARLMGRAVADETSRHFLDLHRGWGVEVLLGEGLRRFTADAGRLSGVETTGGRRIATSLAVVGIGIDPDVELCRAAGLACDSGVVVDECMIAGRDGIAAIGDCAVFRRGTSGPLLRIESVQNATDQARVAARSLLGRREPYRAVPWFWSDQRQIKLQIAGLCNGADESVVRGNPADGRFSVFRYRSDRLMAVDSIDRPGEHLVARKLIAAGLSPSREQAADPDFDLRTLLANASAPRTSPAEPSPRASVLEALRVQGCGSDGHHAR